MVYWLDIDADAADWKIQAPVLAPIYICGFLWYLSGIQHLGVWSPYTEAGQTDETAYIMSIGAISNKYWATPPSIVRIIHVIGAPFWILNIVIQKMLITFYSDTRQVYYVRWHRWLGKIFVFNTILQIILGLVLTYYQSHISHQIFNVLFFGPFLGFQTYKLYTTASRERIVEHRYWGNLICGYILTFPSTQFLITILFRSGLVGVDNVYWIAIIFITVFNHHLKSFWFHPEFPVQNKSGERKTGPNLQKKKS